MTIPQVIRGRTSFIAAVAVVLIVGLTAREARATTIRELNAGGATSSVQAWWSQSVLTPSGGPWGALAFTFLSLSDQPSAVGNLYLLSQEYLGTPNNLSALTPGFMAVAPSAGGFWTFAVGVVIQPNTMYWFYTDTAFPAGSLSGAVQSPFEIGYLTFSGNSPYFNNDGNGNIDYRLTGTVVSAVPEPASLMLVGVGLAAVATSLRRRRAR